MKNKKYEVDKIKITNYIHTPQNPKSHFDETIEDTKKNRIIIEKYDHNYEIFALWKSSKKLRELDKLF